MKAHQQWIDTHCHLDALEFSQDLGRVIADAAQAGVKAILLPTVKAADCESVRALVKKYSDDIPGLVYTLGIHPIYIHQAQEGDLQTLRHEVEKSMTDPRFVGIGEIGLDCFLPGLDPQKQEFFFHEQLDIAEQYQLPVVLHVRRSQDAILKGLRRRNMSGGIAHAFNGSFQQAKQFIELGFKLGFGGAATYDRALQIRRLLAELPIDAIVTETDAPDIPPAWLVAEGLQYNEPAFLPRIARQLAQIRAMDDGQFAAAVWRNAMDALPRWSALLALRQPSVAS
jgi:TatD DNase family protein